MKKILSLIALAICFFACKKEQISQIRAKSSDYERAKLFAFNNNDSAFYYFNRVTTLYKDSLEAAMAYNYMAAIQADAGDYFGAQESLLSSLKFLDENNPKDFECLSADYNELGLNNFKLKNYHSAHTYYDAAIKFSKYEDFTYIIMNNKAVVYQNQKNYIQAIHIYDRIISKDKKDRIAYARTLTNISYAKWLNNPTYNAEPELLTAMHIREKENNDWGRNSSYAHLADYYTDKNPNAALEYAQKMYHISRKLNSPDDQLEALQKLVKLSPSPQNVKYFSTYEALADSIQTVRSAAKNQFAMVRYETEKNKANNLKLQKENTEKKYQIITRDLLLMGAALLLVSLSVIALLWYRKRRQKIESETRNAIRNSQLKTSKRVHDVVANGLYRVMTEIENRENLDRDLILDKLEDMYEKSRDISYDEPLFTDQNFHEKILDLLSSFASETTKVLFMGSTVDIWKKVNVQAKCEIEHVLQELMVNMRKHSGASTVVVRFEQVNSFINIYYADDGIGITENTKFKNGLTNTGNRMKYIQGTITFDTRAEKGLKIHISFPIS